MSELGTYLKDEQNNSWDNHEEKFGNYKLQEGTVNRKAHYISTDGKSAIWYSPKGRWSVGSLKSKGTNKTGIYVSSTDDCPTEPTYDWRYLDQYRNWRDADEGFSTHCYFTRSNLKKMGSL